jgi:ribosome maturation factor RimP
MSYDSLEADLDWRLEEMGFELVKLERVGDSRRPIFRIFLDRPDTVPGQPGVSLDECATLSRALEPMFDEMEGLSEKYVLEVSSPGVERPLVRRRDWERFAGQEVAVRGKQPLAGRARRLEGTLLGPRGEDSVALRLEDGAEVELPLAEVDGANLIYRWDRKKPKP